MFIYNEMTSSIEKTFGSGQQETTKGCLTFIQKLSKSVDFKNILDIDRGLEFYP